jgi:outer membrane protein assembly factor BamE
MSFHRVLSALLLAASVLAGCGGNPLAPYRMEIQQGNYVTQDMVAQIKPGMSKDQVRFALGTPLINDVFHQDRWDYVFMRQRNRHSPLEQRLLTVIFDGNGQLARMEGDIVPAPEAPAGKP